MSPRPAITTRSAAGAPANRTAVSSASFLARAAAWALLLFGLVRVPWVQQNLLVPFAGIQGRIGCALVGAEPNSVLVGLSCTGADPMALVLASVLAFPVSWRQRLRGCAIGLGVILVLNTLRIGTLSLVAGRGELFNLLHVYVWPAVLIVAAAAYVFYWMGSSLGTRAPARDRTATPISFSRTATVRFLGRLIVLVLGFYALYPWLMSSQAVLGIARIATSAAGAAMTAFGVSAEVTGNYLKTANGTWAVTQACIATPLLPVYLAAVSMLPTSRMGRAAMALAALPLFLLLGTARLLVLALPAALLGSHAVAIHAFYQVLAAIVIVAVTAWLSAAPRPASARTGAILRALAAGIAMGLVSGLLFRTGLLPPLEELAHSAHLGHAYADPQGALSLMPPFLLGLFLALWIALQRPPSRWLFAGLGLLAFCGAATTVVLGELATHLGAELPISAIRAAALALPIVLAWWLAKPNAIGERSFTKLIATED